MKLENKQTLSAKQGKIIKHNIEYQQNERELDSEFTPTQNLGNRTRKVFKSQSAKETNKTIKLIGCSHSFLQKWIKSQL